jgi:flagellar basal-body rod protein FlgG
MIRALWTASTGMDAQQLNMDVIANNLANVNTPGFKKSRADFQELLYQTIRTAGSTGTGGNEIPAGIQVGLGTRPAAVQRIFTEGDLQKTGNDMDIAIQGDGFFQVQLPNGTEAYTRAGDFKKDSSGRLVTSDGYPLQPQIVIPSNATKVTIGEDGTVTAFLDGQTTGNSIGTVQLAMFSNPVGLNSLGQNLFTETASSGAPVTGTPGQNGVGTLAQGFLEGSNVSIMQEMVNMIAGQRAYEVNSKAIKSADQMLQMTDNLQG